MLQGWAYTQRTMPDSKEGIKDQVQPSSFRRGIFSTIIASALSIVSSSSVFAEVTMQNAVEFALEACAQLPDGKDTILSSLAQHGWVKSSDSNTLYDLLASTTFAFKHSTENAELLGNSFANAHFMSASILGNSALPPNQPAFVLDDISIGVIGLTLSKNKPWCLLNGPSALFNVFAEKINLTPSKMVAHGFMRNPEGQMHKGQYLDATISVTTMDLDSILLRVREFELDVTAIPYTSDLTFESALERFRPFNAYTSPQRPTGGN